MSLLFQFLFLFTTLFSTSSNGYKPGDTAVDFNLKSVDGKMYSMANFKDAKGYIVVFTCNSCPFAVKYEDRINELAKKYSKKGYVLLAVNPNDPTMKPEDSYELMKERANDKGFVFPYLFDEGQKIYPQYGATKTPHAFLLDKNRVVKYIGAIDDNSEDASMVKEKYLENPIAAMEKGIEPTPSVTKAIGCSIKAKKQS
ncbi:MAG: thioredoxin family protein [Saprospiraceae bacterium]|nr:thioredoxin family protein [Saprospiraceae bacterium]